mmetsp:Transcript_9225/g.13369  ORF Transcript_9225/g.13369 Transcript_9225/m.13369 type:complete len:214 (-) Transcript_9225:246-887(-)
MSSPRPMTLPPSAFKMFISSVVPLNSLFSLRLSPTFTLQPTAVLSSLRRRMVLKVKLSASVGQVIPSGALFSPWFAVSLLSVPGKPPVPPLSMPTSTAEGGLASPPPMSRLNSAVRFSPWGPAMASSPRMSPPVPFAPVVPWPSSVPKLTLTAFVSSVAGEVMKCSGTSPRKPPLLLLNLLLGCCSTGPSFSSPTRLRPTLPPLCCKLLSMVP